MNEIPQVGDIVRFDSWWGEEHHTRPIWARVCHREEEYFQCDAIDRGDWTGQDNFGCTGPSGGGARYEIVPYDEVPIAIIRRLAEMSLLGELTK